MAFLKRELSGSHNIAKATNQALKRFFTARRCPPKGWVGSSPWVDGRLMRQFCDQVDSRLIRLLRVDGKSFKSQWRLSQQSQHPSKVPPKANEFNLMSVSVFLTDDSLVMTDRCFILFFDWRFTDPKSLTDHWLTLVITDRLRLSVFLTDDSLTPTHWQTTD